MPADVAHASLYIDMSDSSSLPTIHWTEDGAERSALWRSEAGLPPPKRVVIADDQTPADTAFRLASEGVALLWRGDFQNARQSRATPSLASRNAVSAGVWSSAITTRFGGGRPASERHSALRSAPSSVQWMVGREEESDIFI